LTKPESIIQYSGSNENFNIDLVIIIMLTINQLNLPLCMQVLDTNTFYFYIKNIYIVMFY